MLATTFVEYAVWAVAAAICLLGALGVVLFRNPVHNALSLVATLFGVAVLFVAQEAYFLAAIQVIVYAGAIVVLFLFVIMLLGVDAIESLGIERHVWRRPVAIVAGAGLVALVLVAVLVGTAEVTGQPSSTGSLGGEYNDIERIGRALFTDYVWAFEITAVLLTIAVVGAVVLSRKPTEAALDEEEFERVVEESRLDEDVPEELDDDELDELEADDEAVGSEDLPTYVEEPGVTS